MVLSYSVVLSMMIILLSWNKNVKCRFVFQKFPTVVLSLFRYIFVKSTWPGGEEDAVNKLIGLWFQEHVVKNGECGKAFDAKRHYRCA